MKTKSVKLHIYKDEEITLKGNETHLFNFLCELALIAYDANVYNLNEGYTNTADNYMELFRQISKITNKFTTIKKGQNYESN